MNTKTLRKSVVSKNVKPAPKKYVTADIKTLGAYTKKNSGNFPSDTWVVFTVDSTGRRSAKLYDGSLTRDRVRLAYSRTYKTDFVSTRSRRISNF